MAATAFELQGKVSLDTGDVDKKLKSLGTSIKKGLSTAVKVGATALGTAAVAITKLTKSAVTAYAQYEQLAGGAQKIFDKMDYSKIEKDAQNAYKNMNISASEYLSMINQVGASFATNLGDKKGYQAAKEGLQAIADYASGTGRSMTELSDKFSLITRSTSSYQSIADQFSGILPATSKDFLKQAQSAGYLSKKYKNLTEVPIAEYQKAVSKMLKKGVKDMGLAGNAADESAKTITGSLAATKAAWKDLLVSFGSGSAKDIKKNMKKFVKSAKNVVTNIMPVAKNALTGLGTFVKEIAPVVIAYLPELVQELIPSFLDAATSLAAAIIKAIPALIKGIFNAIGTAMDSLSSWLQEHFPKLGSAFDSLRSGAKKAFNKVKELWNGTLKPALDEIISKAIEIWNTVSPYISSIADAISTAWTGTIEPAFTAIKSYVTDTLAPAVKTAWEDNMKPAIDTVKESVTRVKNAFLRIKTALEPIAGKFNDIKAAIEDYVTSGQLGEDITKALKKAITFLANALSRVSTWIANAIEKIADIIEWFTSFENASTALKTALLIVWNSIKRGIIKRVNAIKTKASDAWETLKGNIATSVDGIKSDAEEKWEAVKTAVTDKVDAMRRLLTAKFTVVKLKIKNVWAGIKTALTKPIEDAKEAISKAWEEIKGWFNTAINLQFKLPKITMGKKSFSTKSIIGIDLGTIDIPWPEISWNKKAYNNPYLFNKPTVMAGFGDGAGGEMVYGHSALMRDIKNAVSGVAAGDVTINVYAQPNQNAAEIAQAVQKEFVRWNKQRRAAFA